MISPFHAQHDLLPFLGRGFPSPVVCRAGEGSS
jgi:hypothetical protein